MIFFNVAIVLNYFPLCTQDHPCSDPNGIFSSYFFGSQIGHNGSTYLLVTRESGFCRMNGTIFHVSLETAVGGKGTLAIAKSAFRLV